MRRKIIAISLLCLLLLFLSGCITQQSDEADDNDDDTTPTYSDGDTKCIGYDLYTYINDGWVLTERDCEICGYIPPTPQYDDIVFMDWIDTTNNVLLGYSNNIVDCLGSSSYYMLEYYAEAEEDLVDDTYKPQCLAFSLSYDYDRIRDEYYDYLSDLSWASFYIKLAAGNMQDGYYSSATDNFNDATDYTERATAHLQNVNSMINNLI